MLAVGRVGKSHGVRGEFVLRSLSGETEHLLRLKQLTLIRSGDPKETTLEIETVRRAHDRVLVKLRGFDTPEAVESLRGMDAWVERRHAAPLGREEYYVADLIGCRVLIPSSDGGSQEAGEIAGVIEGPSDDFLEVVTEDHRQVLVPFRAEYVGAVDLKRRRIEVVDREIFG